MQGRAVSLKKAAAELTGDRRKSKGDFDPEDIAPAYSASSADDGSGSDDGASDADEARAHYEDVGVSKLRKPESASLGPQYAGSRIRRDAVDEVEEDDPFDRDFGDSESEAGEAEEDADQDSRFGGSEQEQDDEESSNEQDEYMDTRLHQNGSVDRTQLRKLMAEDQKNVAATLSQSAKADAEKGKAVKAQRSTFDALLNSRIKLQKALVAVNSSLDTEEDVETATPEDTIRAAEGAAVTLWNNLNSLRNILHNAKTGQKRSAKVMSTDDDLQSFWEDSQVYELAQKKPRITTLDFWASKTRTSSALSAARGASLRQPVKEQALSDVLEGQLSDMSRLVSKTRVPRSCAPLQAAALSKQKPGINGAHEETSNAIAIYDDADFYTTLLANLISQRSETSNLSLGNLNLQPWQAAREARTKKVVDTKASKGRKLRYTVHEKLVGFMAPEDRGAWGDRQRAELFAGLLGRRGGLNEDEESEAEDEADINSANDKVGLRLFG